MMGCNKIFELFIALTFMTLLVAYPVYYVYGTSVQALSGPVINDPSLKAELVVKGLKNPTSMAFLAPNDILVLEKNTGTVLRIGNGTVSSEQPMLHLNVATAWERGLLGVTVAKHDTKTTYVFLYYTQAGGNKTGSDVSSGIQPVGNRVYRYGLIDNQLVNPKLLLNLPASPGPIHNGGKILIGPDENLYLVIGDLYYPNRTQAQNVQNGPPPDGTSGILRVTEDGKAVPNGPLGDTFPISLYYAYGIRNSFGMDFDPVTGKLWDTENGPNYGDEINFVEPGFNSGWAQVQGIWSTNGDNAGPINLHPSNLVDFGGKGKYRAPEFVWFQPVAPTALKFLNSTKLGKQYQDDMFVGDYNHGNLYHFKLNQNRTGLVLSGSLSDKIAYTPEQSKPVILGSGFNGGITDLEVGPDGYLYVLTFFGSIYRIVPSALG
jgi:glucose/arabinose dehydrogenase